MTYKNEILKDANYFSKQHNIKTTSDLILAQSIISSPIIAVHIDTMKHINKFIALVAFVSLLSPLESSDELRSRELKADKATKGPQNLKAPKWQKTHKATKAPKNMKA